MVRVQSSKYLSSSREAADLKLQTCGGNCGNSRSGGTKKLLAKGTNQPNKRDPPNKMHPNTMPGSNGKSKIGLKQPFQVPLSPGLLHQAARKTSEVSCLCAQCQPEERTTTDREAADPLPQSSFKDQVIGSALCLWKNGLPKLQTSPKASKVQEHPLGCGQMCGCMAYGCGQFCELG